MQKSFIQNFPRSVMGSYLSQPVTEKESSYGETRDMRYAVTAMQGWRTEMEDSHLTLPNIGGNMEGISLFCVCMSCIFVVHNISHRRRSRWKRGGAVCGKLATERSPANRRC